MKTDERMAERIAHLERDIKILKNEVQSVLVDLRDKYLEAGNPFNAPPGPASSQQVIVLQAPAASQASSGAELHSGSAEKTEVRDKTQEPTEVSEAGKETHPETVKKEVRDKTQEPTGVSETAREEVIQAQIPAEVLSNTRPRIDHIPDRDINLISISGLVSWAEESVKKLGYQKTEAILDVAEIMGLLSPQLKQIMIKLINIDSDGNAQSMSARVFLDSLVKITTLLGKDNQTEAALLSILSREDDHG
jgi:archaellum component FlaD/FlaE